jgi:hypothetical protein
VRWHQDIQAWPHTNFGVLTFGVYLDDTGPEQGPLTALPGTQSVGTACPFMYHDDALYLEAGDLVDSGEDPYVGSFRTEIVPVLALANEPLSFLSFAALPGTNRGRLADETEVYLSFFAALDVRVLDDAGIPLQLADAATATLTLEPFGLPDGGTRFFHYDQAANEWVEAGFDGACDCCPATCSVAIDRLGWWAVAVPYSAVSCVRGVIEDNGDPSVGTDVRVGGTSFAGVAATRSDSAGAFCLNTQIDSDIVVVGTRVEAPETRLLAVFPGASSTVAATCEDALVDCQDLGTLELAPDNAQCAYGTFTLHEDFVDGAWLSAPLPPFSLEQETSGNTPFFRGRRRPDDEALACFNLPGTGGLFWVSWDPDPALLCDAEIYQSASFNLTQSDADAELCEETLDDCTLLSDVDFYCHS